VGHGIAVTRRYLVLQVHLNAHGLERKRKEEGYGIIYKFSLLEFYSVLIT
jgi:hypothetical protein